MSEVHGEQEAEQFDEFNGIINEAVGGSFPALRNFDNARLQLYTDLSHLTGDNLSLETAQRLDIDGVSERFGTLLGYLLDESDSVDDFVETAVHIMTTDSYERISMIRQALDDECVGLDLESKKLIRNFTKSVYNLDTMGDVIESMVSFYDSDIKADINHLVEGLAADEDISLDDSEKPVVERKDIKEHAVEIAKLAAGMAITAALARMFGKYR